MSNNLNNSDTDMRRNPIRGGVALLAVAIAAPASAAPVQWAGNGHWYEVIPNQGVSWASANTTASSMTHLGLPGHLATVTSAAEDAFIAGLINNAGQHWGGGYQDDGVTPADAGWKWVTGEGWGYTNWAGGEPNDNYGPASEQHLGLGWNGTLWNDEGNLGNLAGFVVEYSQVPDQGATLALLAGGLAALGWLRRRGAARV